MVSEVVDITVVPGQGPAFERAVSLAIEKLVIKARGYRGWRILRGVESTNRYLLVIEWDSVEDHMQDFRNSPAFLEWRKLVTPYFAAPAKMEHFQLLKGGTS